MSLKFGRPTVAIPGPSMIPERVLNAMHRPAPNIYAGELVDQTARIKAGLKRVAGTSGDALIYIGNGHAGWEAALSNLVNPGDRLMAICTGRFVPGWAEMAERFGAVIESIDFGTRAPLDANRIEDHLRADRENPFSGVLVAHTDTASSVRNDIASLRAAMDAARHPALLLVDCIASLACEPYDMDALGADVTIAACQKGLMTPPGLTFNFVNDKASRARDRVTRTTGYWDWRLRQDPEIYYMNFYGTAPTHLLYGLEEALRMILDEEGLDNVIRRHDIHAAAVWAAIDVWAEAGAMELNIADPAHRSTAVTTIHFDRSDDLRTWSEDRTGLTLGVGLDLTGGPGAPPSDTFRIGHMGHLNPPMLLGTLATIEAGLAALGTPRGNGAIDAAARVIAEALPV